MITVIIIKIGIQLLNMKQAIQLKNVGLYDLSPFSKFEIKSDQST